jgi:hypothetical protein
MAVSAYARTPQEGPQDRYLDYMREWGMLDQQYTSGQWQQRQREVLDYVQPYRGRFELDEQNKQPRKDQNIVNDTASDAAKKLSAAALTGITSAARKWLGLGSMIREIRDDHESRVWFEEARDLLLQLFAESNTYKVLPSVYDDVICPATSLAWLEEDERDVIRAVHTPVGQYRLCVDSRRRVSRVFWRFSMTVDQVVEKFGQSPDGELDLSNFSPSLQNQWRNKRYYDWVTILHVTEPRVRRLHGKIDRLNKPWASCWMEWSGPMTQTGGLHQPQDPAGPHTMLSEGGWDEQPFIAPRWETVGEDAYGSQSPSMQAIGDIKGIQALENSGVSIIATMQKPPMNVPPSLVSGSIIPGARNNIEDPRVKFEPSYVPRAEAVTVGENKLRQYEMRIQRAHYGDLLFLISSDPRTQPATAEEIRAKQQERLLALGGFFGRFSDEALTPLINRALAIAQRKGLLPPPPRKLLEVAMRGGQRLVKAEYLNSIAEAQKAQGVAPILGWVNDMVTISKTLGRTDVTDKVNFDGVAEMTADMRGVPAKLVVPDDVVQQKRQAQAQAAQQAQQSQQAVEQAKAVKDLSQADPNQMDRVFSTFGPAAAAEATGGGL